MEIIKDLNDLDISGNSVVTIGNFDGLHRGHQGLINRTINLSSQKHLTSVILTFVNHPLNFIMKKEVKNIMTENQKYQHAKEFGINKFLSIKFDDYICNLSPESFVKEIIAERLKAKEVVVGHDFRFAKNRMGNVDTLRELAPKYGYNVTEVNPITINKYRVSSTLIRKLISSGNVKEAATYLGRKHEITGKVIHGRKNGRNMGFPTANIEFEPNIIMPKAGVYCTQVLYRGKIYKGATNIGYNPTIKDDNQFSVETHILDFDKIIYGEEITVYFIDRVRDEKKFESVDTLVTQMKKDVNHIRNMFTD